MRIGFPPEKEVTSLSGGIRSLFVKKPKNSI
jgi:hypothetical protein